jgi:Fe-S oxidoreductase
MQTAGELARHDHNLTKEELETLWGCSACGACEDECRHHNPVGKALYDARATATEEGKQPEAVTAAVKQFNKHGNPFGVSLVDRQREIARDSKLHAGAPALLLGCHALGEDGSLAQLALTLARKVRPDVWVPLSMDPNGEQVICCGRVLDESGERRMLQHHRAKMNLALAGTTEWWILETTCFDAYVAMAAEHPNKPRVITLAEAVAASDLKPTTKVRSLTLHLGCGVRRHPKGEEALRALAGRATDDVRVPPADMQFSGCCGGRGGIATVMPKVAADMGAGRRAELAEFKAEQAVHFSTCCGGQLGDAARHLLELYA